MNKLFRPGHSDDSARRPGEDDPDNSSGGRAEPTARMAFISILGFWLVYFVLATARALVNDLPAQGEMLVRRLVVTLAAIALTGLLYALLRRFDDVRTGKLLTIAFAASVPLAFAYSTVNYIAFYGFPIAEHLEMEMEKTGGEGMDPVSLISSTAIEWYFFIASWAVMWVALSYSVKVRRVEREAAEFRQAAQSAELRALRYQVNPHFLFNTLNSIAGLIEEGASQPARDMTLRLAGFPDHRQVWTGSAPCQPFSVAGRQDGLARKKWRAPTEEPGGVLWETGTDRGRSFGVKRCGWH